MFNKYFILITIIISLTLTGCIFNPCNTTLKIINDNNILNIILIENNEIFQKFKINNNEVKYFDKEIMKNIYFVYINNETMEGIFELREYDHWFSRDHNIEIIIKNNEFIISNDLKNITYDFSYDIYTNKDKEIINFEKIKESTYKNIYEIIKKIE